MNFLRALNASHTKLVVFSALQLHSHISAEFGWSNIIKILGDVELAQDLQKVKIKKEQVGVVVMFLNSKYACTDLKLSCFVLYHMIKLFCLLYCKTKEVTKRELFALFTPKYFYKIMCVMQFSSDCGIRNLTLLII